jgi:hypothetical protein
MRAERVDERFQRQRGQGRRVGNGRDPNDQI